MERLHWLNLVIGDSTRLLALAQGAVQDENRSGNVTKGPELFKNLYWYIRWLSSLLGSEHNTVFYVPP